MTPRSVINNAVRLHLDVLPKNKHSLYMAEVKKYFDSKCTVDELIFYCSVKANYINIGFPNQKDCVKAMSKPICYNEKPIPMEIAQYANKQERWLIFLGLPNKLSSNWVAKAITTGIFYYGSVVQWNTRKPEFLPQCFVHTTIHALLDPLPLKVRTILAYPDSYSYLEAKKLSRSI